MRCGGRHGRRRIRELGRVEIEADTHTMWIFYSSLALQKGMEEKSRQFAERQRAIREGSRRTAPRS